MKNKDHQAAGARAAVRSAAAELARYHLQAADTTGSAEYHEHSVIVAEIALDDLEDAIATLKATLTDRR